MLERTCGTWEGGEGGEREGLPQKAVNRDREVECSPDGIQEGLAHHHLPVLCVQGIAWLQGGFPGDFQVHQVVTLGKFKLEWG